MGEMFLDDGDVRLYQGDVEVVLAGMSDESVDCVVTSPPYWGLRDYGTGLWEGGDPDCDHAKPTTNYNHGFNERWGQGAGERKQERKSEGQYPDTCPKCGARRLDQQLGLEPTPDLYVQRIVSVFREVRRVLAPHGTCWVNLGDSYNSAASNDWGGWWKGGQAGIEEGSPAGRPEKAERRGLAAGLKPKDLVGIPWRVAFALQADGWYLRSDIVWSKPNPMPESVTDRPTKAHEYVFLLTKAPRYYFDQEAVREAAEYGRSVWAGQRKSDGGAPAYRSTADANRPAERGGFTVTPGDGTGGRNVRSVWQIATQPYPEAHFATYPEELVRRCVLAGCPERVCRVCGKPSERIVESESYITRPTTGRDTQKQKVEPTTSKGLGRVGGHVAVDTKTVGWSECDCLLSEGVPSEVSAASHADASFPVAPGAAPSESKWRTGVVLDPFIGSGTTAKVARDHGRHSIGIDLSADYLNLAARRLQQLSLLT